MRLSNENYTVVKIIVLQKVILHCGKKSLFWSLIIFGYLNFTMVRGQKIGFNSFECIKFLNIANFHAFHVWGKHVKLQWYIFPSLFFIFLFLQRNFYPLRLRRQTSATSSAIYSASPFTGHPTYMCSAATGFSAKITRFT